jgi:hypothetical protein
MADRKKFLTSFRTESGFGGAAKKRVQGTSC